MLSSHVVQIKMKLFSLEVQQGSSLIDPVLLQEANWGIARELEYMQLERNY